MKTLTLILLIGAVLAACKAAPEGEAAKAVVEVTTAKAERADLSLTVRSPATIFPRQQANIVARLTARIARLEVRKGDRVAAGQLLARLENRDLIAQRDGARAAIAEAEASLQKTTGGTLPTEIQRGRGQVATARASLDQAQKIYDRRKQLFEQGAIPERDLLLSETTLAQARTELDVARKSLDLLETQSGEKDIRIAQSHIDQARARLGEINAQLEFAEIRSPFAGVITDQMMFAGDMAKPELPILTLMDLSVAVARAQTPEVEARAARTGQACSFSPADQPDASHTGRIAVITPAVDPARRTVEIWCEMANPQQRLRGGEFGTLSIATGTARQSVVVPLTAVQFSEDGKKGVVMVVDDKGIAHSRDVETGEVIEGRVRIVEGLNGGETVVSEGGYGLPDGTQVKVTKEKAVK